MLSYIESVAVVLSALTIAFGIVLFLRRNLNADMRRRANGVNGWQLSILGSLYAVVLGFMLSDAWTTFQNADVDARSEAAAASVTYRMAALLPPACADPLRLDVQQYLETVITTEWPAMENGQANFNADHVIEQAWRTLDDCKNGSSELKASVIQPLQLLQTRHMARVQDFSGRFPLILWIVLLFGGTSVIAAACILQNERHYIHLFHVLSLTLLVSVTLLAIFDLDRPFNGGTRVMPTSFSEALLQMQQ